MLTRLRLNSALDILMEIITHLELTRLRLNSVLHFLVKILVEGDSSKVFDALILNCSRRTVFPMWLIGLAFLTWLNGWAFLTWLMAGTSDSL